jgi:ABC-type glycerol-3-phosphate transport system permease component
MAVTDMSRTGSYAAPRRGYDPRLILSYVPLMIVVGLLVLVPLVWMISTSFKGRQEFYSATATLLPLHPTLINYRYVLTQLGYMPV